MRGEWRVAALVKVSTLLVGRVRVVWRASRGLDLAIVEGQLTDAAALEVMRLPDAPVQVGARVFAIGNPLGLAWSYSAGTLSAVRQWTTQEGLAVQVLQTDTAIAPGSSGGGLFHEDGRLLGVMSFARQGGMGGSVHFALGVEAVNRYENHLINTGWQAVDMIKRVGADNVFVHLDTYHMNIEEKGIGTGILDARDFIKYIHLSESDRGTPGYGNCAWDEIFATLAAIGFKGGLAMESFINMPPEVAYGLAVWRPVAKDEEEVMGNGLPFLRNKARQYGLI